MVDAATRTHEAAHAASALWFGGRRVERISVDEVDAAGRATMPLTRSTVEPEDLITALVGWMADGSHPSWPPPWPPREDETDGVGVIVRILDLDQERYEALIEIAEQTLATPDFQRLMNLIARALRDVPVLDATSVELLREATGVSTLNEEEPQHAA